MLQDAMLLVRLRPVLQTSFPSAFALTACNAFGWSLIAAVAAAAAAAVAAIITGQTTHRAAIFAPVACTFLAATATIGQVQSF